jgi:ABC-type transport system substrate-binding protein
MTIYRPEFSVYIGRETSSDFDMLFTGQGNRGNFALTDLDRFSNDMFGSRNFCLYSSPEAQEIIDQMRSPDTTPEELTALIQQINEILGQDVPMVALYNSTSRCAAANGLTGFRYDGWGRTDFRNASYTG